jgi:hypothetical protein
LSFEDPFQLPFDVKVEETIKQMVYCSCEKILLKDIEHETTIDQEKLFVDKQTIFFYIIEDPFAILLESTMKMSFEMFINYGYSFRWQFKLSYFQFFFLLIGAESKQQLRSHLLDCLYWKFEIT